MAMLVQVVIAVVVGLIAVGVAVVLTRRSRPHEPADPTNYDVPNHLERADFDRPETPWLVAVFSSSTCLACADVWEKARQLESADVAVQDVEAAARKDLHDRYKIDAVPMVVLADGDGDVRASFIGVPTAADLWSALAELRDRNSTQ
jgi:thioredoxin-related protein